MAQTFSGVTTGYGDRTLDQKDYGYRSNGIDVNIGYLTEGRTNQAYRVTYNGFTFPPTAKMRVTLVPEYDQTGRHVKYHTLAISIEAIISPYNSDVLDSNAKNPGLYGAYGTDIVMEDIRNRLGQNGQNLRIDGLGCGRINVVNQDAIDVSKGVNVEKLINSTQGNYRDVDYGPKPQVIEWEPVGGNKIVRIEWLCTARILWCPNAAAFNKSIIQLNHSIDWTITHEGLMARTVSGMVEFPGQFTSDPYSTTPNLQKIPYRTPAWADFAKWINARFPVLPGFKRTVSFSLAEDRKTTKFNIQDEEYRNPDQPLPRYTAEFSLQQKVSSSLKKAFKVWNMSMSGEFTVPANSKYQTHMMKKLAFATLGLILQDRINRIRSGVNAHEIKDRTQNAGDTVSDQTQPFASISKPTKSNYLLQKIEIVDDVWDNKVSFAFSWMLYDCSPNLLFQNTGMLDRIRVQEVNWTNHNQGVTEVGVHSERINPHPQHDTVVDLCHPMNLEGEYPNTPRTGNDFYVQNPTSLLASEKPAEKDSYISYDMKLDVRTKGGSIIYTPLSDETPIKETNDSSGDDDRPLNQHRNKATDKFDDSEHPSNEQSEEHTTLRNRKDQTLITMTGFAIRDGYPVRPPKLLRYGGQVATRVGERNLKQQQFSVNMGDGTQRVYYRLDWELEYVTTRKPKTLRSQSTGEPDLYLA